MKKKVFSEISIWDFSNDLFAYVRHQENDTYGLGFKSNMKRIHNEKILLRVIGETDVKVVETISNGVYHILNLL